MLPDRVAAIIIHDKKILLVSGKGFLFYWTPGGKIESGESHETALVRELQEEIRVTVVSSQPYIIYKTVNEATGKHQTVYSYLVHYEGEISPDNEITTYGWFSKEKLPPITDGIKSHILPKLLSDGFL